VTGMADPWTQCLQEIVSVISRGPSAVAPSRPRISGF